MKSFKFLIILALISGIISSYTYYYFEIKVVEYENSNFAKINNEKKLFVFNSNKNNFDIINYTSEKNYIDEGDLISELINIFPFLNLEYKILAVYELDDKMIIKVNKKFNDLNTEEFDHFIKSVYKTLEYNFISNKDLSVEIDSN